MLATVMRPVALTLLGRVQAELDQVPQPADPPQFHAPGPDPDRVLIFGNGPAMGFGVRTQELALPGQVGRRLARRTGRGVHIDLVARRGTSVESAVGLVAGLRPARYDGLVVALGATDAAALLPVRRWRAAMARLLGELIRLTSADAPIVVLGIHSLRRSASTSGLLGDLVDQHGRRLNTVTRALCAADPRLVYADRSDVRAETVRHQSAQSFALLADVVAPALARGLDRVVANGSGARALRDVQDPETERQAAVEALGLLDTPPEERFDRIVRTARSSFGARFAAVSLIDGDRQWYKAVAGPPAGTAALPQELDRRNAVCDRTIRSDQPLVVADLAAGPETYPEIAAAGYRFYAGVPIESPDGYRIGALCVLDTEPRRLDEVDTALLREFAQRVQRELWTSPQDAVRHLTPAR